MIIRNLIVAFGLLACFATAIASPCTPYGRLQQLIENGNSFGVPPGLPEQMPVIASRSLGREYLKVAQMLWSDVRPSAKLVSAYGNAADKGVVDAKLLADSKALRARLKIIRALCDSICRDHETPAVLDDTIKAMGKFQDAATHGAGNDEIRAIAAQVRDAFSGRQYEKFEKAIASMEPSGRKDNAAWLRDNLNGLKKLLKKSELSEDEFHSARKVLGRFQTLVLMDAINGNEQSARAYESIRKFYDELGAAHDRMVENAAKGEDEIPAAFSPEDTAMMKNIIRALRKGN